MTYDVTFRGVYGARELRSVRVSGFSADNATLRARALESWFGYTNAEFVCAHLVAEGQTETAPAEVAARAA